MTRKESEKDSERPHYYSQFWLDIAAGRRTIGGPKPEDGEALESEAVEPALQRRSTHVGEQDAFQNSSSANGHRDDVGSSAEDDEDYNESDEDLLPEQDEEQNDDEYQEEAPLQDGDLPDMDLGNEEEQDAASEEEQDESNENLDEEEDDDTKWGGRSRKKGKAVRPSKPPIKKPGKPRRSGGF